MTLSRKTFIFTIGLSVGFLALPLYFPVSSTDSSQQAAAETELQLNGLHLNTRQSNIITFNGTTVHGTSQLDWIDPDITSVILPNQQQGHLSLQGGQLMLQITDQ